MTAVMPSGGEGGPAPLGELLVRHGVVTEDQLEAALERQRETGRPLGEIIVSLGYAPGPIVAQALATQHGGLLKTEYGFATGWSTGREQSPPSEPAAPAPARPDVSAELAARDRTIAQLREWVAGAQAAIASRDEAITRLQAALAEARRGAPDAARATVDEEETARLHEAVEAAKGELAARDEEVARLRDELSEARAAGSSGDEALERLRAEAESRQAEVERVSAGLAARDAEIARLREELSEARAAEVERTAGERAARDEEVARLREELSEARAAGSSGDEALERLRAEAESRQAEVERVSAELAARDAEIARLREEGATRQTAHERDLASLEQARAELTRRLENTSSRAAELAHRVAGQEEELGALRAAAEAAAGTAAEAEAPPGRWASASRHYVFLRGTAGYDLVERDGPPPPVGDVVDGRRVARVAASPVPGVPCAYLAD